MSAMHDRLEHAYSPPERYSLRRWVQRRMAWRRHPARPRTIFLFGLFGYGNLGNDGSLQAMVEFLRTANPEAQLVCVCPRPDLVTERLGIGGLPIRFSGYLSNRWKVINRWLAKVPGKLFDLAETFGSLRKADLMIIPGTGVLDDFGERPFGFPLEIFKWCLIARLMGTKIAFVSIGAGPINHPLSRWLMVSAAKLASHRSYRDEFSRAFMERSGVNVDQDRVWPDLAFRLPTPRHAAPDPGHRLRVGVGVMNYSGWYGDADGETIFSLYIGKLSQFVAHLLDAGHKVRLLTGELTDSVGVEALLDRVRHNRPDLPIGEIEAQPSYSLGDLMDQMAPTDVVVATRFHNIVCALKMCKPTISLGYSRKNEVLMAEMGLGEYCQHVEKFSLEDLIEQFTRLTANPAQYELEIRNRIAEFSVRIEKQNGSLRSLVA